MTCLYKNLIGRWSCAPSPDWILVGCCNYYCFKSFSRLEGKLGDAGRRKGRFIGFHICCIPQFPLSVEKLLKHGIVIVMIVKSFFTNGFRPALSIGNYHDIPSSPSPPSFLKKMVSTANPRTIHLQHYSLQHQPTTIYHLSNIDTPRATHRRRASALVCLSICHECMDDIFQLIHFPSFLP